MKITIFTPTYNRAHLLPRLYDSLKNQEYTELEWVIMDDGSKDNTKELVESWINESKIEIIYNYQMNQGRFAAFNNAMSFFKGDLILFVDSDDYLLPNSILKIVDVWNKITDKRSVSGIIAYMQTDGGKVLGSKFPEGVKRERIYTLYDKYKMKGDKFIAFRNDLIQKYKYPVFKNERFTGDSIIFNAMNQDAPMYLLREKITFREYQEDSITKNLLDYHLSSPNGMREHYKDCLKYDKYNKYNIFKHCVGYISFALLTKINCKDIIINSPRKFWTIISYPAGIIYFRKCKKYNRERKI